MREALTLQLEKFSYYQHLSLSGGQERPIYSSRVLDIRGSRYHVLSRIQDAGLDFTGRTNFLAHHLVFTPEEIRQYPSPPIILARWPGWLSKWNQEPQSLENEDWSGLAGISGTASVPATTWQQVTGDAVNGYGLLESRAGIAIRVDNLKEDKILELFAESLELLELRDPRRDFRVTAWQYTFTTSMQDQDNPADFRWRCLHSDNPASNRFAGPDSCLLSDVRASRVTSEEKIFAQSGRQPPRFVIQPQSIRITDGQQVRLCAKAEGVPSPSYQWYAVDKAGNGQPIANGKDAEIELTNPPFGLSRYVVRASNSQGEVTSVVAELSVNAKPRLVVSQPSTELRVQPKRASPEYVKSSDDIDRQRHRLEAEEAEKMFKKNLRLKKFVAIFGVLLGIIALAIGSRSWWRTHYSKIAIAPQYMTSSNIIAHGLGSNTQGSSNHIAEPPKPLLLEKTPNDITPENQGVEHKKSQPSDGFDQLPPGWTRINVGSVTKPRVDSVTSKWPFGFNLDAAALGFSTNGDNALFVCRTNPGSEFLAALVGKFTRGSPQSRNGIMLRQSEKPDSAFLFIGASSEKIFVYRRDGNLAFASTNVDIPANSASGTISFKFDETKDGKSMEAYYFDAEQWISFPDLTIPADANALVGFAQSSGSNEKVVKARFFDESITIKK